MKVTATKTIVSIELKEDEYNKLTLPELIEKAKQAAQEKGIEGDYSIFISTKNKAFELKIEA